MSVVQIPNLTAGTSLNGTEQLEAVQSGSSVRITTAQIGTYINSNYPAPGISSVTANSPLTSSTVSGAVTISLPTQSITNAYLATMAANTVKANLSGSTSAPSNVTPSAILDTFGTQVGSLLYRSSTGWAALTSGTNAQVLTATGTTTAPTWTSLALGTMASQNANAVAITGGTISGVAITTSTINQTPIGATTPSTGAFTNLSASGTVTLGTIIGATWQGNPIAVNYGGTGATDAATARSNLGAAKSGANSDITSLSGLTTPLSSPQGGTGFSSYTTGDLLYADSSTTLARLNDVATGNALISGGVGVAPSWGKIGLTTHITGTLGVANGGTGATSLTGYLVGNGVGAFTAVSTIPNAGLTNSTITIGSTTVALGATTSTLAGLTTVTLTQDPTAALQASTKQYVDNQVATVSNTTFHTASGYATTANLTANYANGTGGVGATLTNSGALAALTIDGYTFLASDVTNGTRVLVKDQSSGLQNGIYVVTNQGSGSVAWVLTRAVDFNTVGTGPNYIETGAATFVTSGSVNASTGWVMTTTGTITVGSTALTWAQTSSSSSVTVTAPLTKVGSVISLGTVTVPFGGTGLTTLTQYGVMLGNGTGNVAFASPGTSGYALLSNGASANPSFGQLSLTAGVTGTLPVANGGTGTSTAFTAGSVVFAGASGTYSQSNSKFFWDNTNNRLGINTATPQTQLTVVANTQTVTPSAALPAGTDIYIVGANASNTRITQDAYGTGSYGVFTARSARGTAASPTASQSGDFLTQFTGRGYGATGFATASTGYLAITAGENFTDTAQGTYASIFTTAIGANSPTEAFRFGTAGQLGIGGATYGTSGYVLTSGGASAAPTWSQISISSVTGVLPVANGGTNISSYTIGDLIYASGTTTLSKLADVATGNALISGGVGVAPSWGKIGLTTHVSGTLPIANGGTNLATTPTNGQLLIGNGTGYTLAALTQGTNIAITNGAGSISIATSATPTWTSETTPIIYGGTAASSSLTLQSTSGVGTSDSILFKVGNNGATTAMTIDTSGNVGIGVGSATTTLSVFSSGGAQKRAIYVNSGSGAGSPGGIYLVSSTVSGANGATLEAVGQRSDGNTSSNFSGNVLLGHLRTDAAISTSGSNLGRVGFGGNPTGTALSNILYSAQIVGVTDGAWSSSSAMPTALAFYTGTSGIDVNSSISEFGTERMRIDSSGNVGIGTTSPGQKLDVGAGSGAQVIRVNGGATNSGDGGAYFIGNAGTTVGAFGNYSEIIGGAYNADPLIWAGSSRNLIFITGGGANERMRIDSSGNVGVGTSSPNYVMQLYKAGAVANYLQVTSGATGAASANGTLFGVDASGNGIVTVQGSVNYITSVAGAERMRIDSSGNVAIGTTSAFGNKFFIAGSANAGLSVTDGSNTIAMYGNGGTAVAVGTANSVPLFFTTAATERMRIDSSGNLLVGTTSATSGALLTVNGGIADSKGDVRRLPINSQTSAYVLVVGDAGKTISITTGGVTVNSGIFSAGDNITIFNNSASSQTITQGTSVTIYQAGTANTGNRTLAQRGVCTLLCVASNTFTISGAGIS